MIQIKKLSVRNFMSVGNATQGIDFDRRDLTLVLGENLDLGGDGSPTLNLSSTTPSYCCKFIRTYEIVFQRV
jgi:hypothetical protein